MTWWAIAAVAATCFALRVGVPLALRTRTLPVAVETRLNAAVPAVVAALVALQVFTRGGRVTVDARAAGVAAAAIAFLARRSLILSLAAAAAVTALARLA